MKILVLGIDGLGEQSLSAFKLPRLSEVIRNSEKFSPSIDNVVSRGWADIYSGKTAYETGAFYQIPVMEKKRISPSQSTGITMVSDHVGEENILWNQLSQRGHHVGLYTLPTVTKIQDKIEFSVTATGGGNFKNTVGPKDVFPSTLVRLADYDKTNLGMRMGYGSFLPSSVKELERWMRSHLAQHFHTFEMMLLNSNVDTAIFGTRFVTLAYKFISLLNGRTTDLISEELKISLLNLADEFDQRLNKLVLDLNPEHLFIVSDHGVGELQYHININELLHRASSSNTTIARDSLQESSIRAAKLAAKSVIGRFNGRKYAPSFPRYNLTASEAFSINYTDVIYINDDRFTGAKMSSEQRFDKASSLCEALTNYVSEHGYKQFLSFTPLKHSGYTSPQANSNSRVPLPDIRCHLAEGCVNLGRTYNEIVSPVQAKFDSSFFEGGFFAEHSGCKVTDTIAAYRGESASKVKVESLTDLYSSVLSVS